MSVCKCYLALTHSVVCVLCVSMSSALSAIKITNFYVLIWMDKQWKWRLRVVGRAEENGREKRQPLDIFDIMLRVCILYIMHCVHENRIFLSRYKFSHSLLLLAVSLSLLSVVFNSEHCLLCLFRFSLFTQWPSFFPSILFLFSHILSHSLSHIFITILFLSFLALAGPAFSLQHEVEWGGFFSLPSLLLLFSSLGY